MEVLSQAANEALDEVAFLNLGVAEVIVRLTRSSQNDLGHSTLTLPPWSPACLCPAIEVPYDIRRGVVHGFHEVVGIDGALNTWNLPRTWGQLLSDRPQVRGPHTIGIAHSCPSTFH